MAKVHIAKPPKPVAEMTDEERRAFAELIYEALMSDDGGQDE